MNRRALLRRPTGYQAGTLTLPCCEQQNTPERPRGLQAGTLTLPGYEQQNTAEKKNRLKLALLRCHVMNSRPLLRRPTGPQAGILAMS